MADTARVTGGVSSFRLFVMEPKGKQGNAVMFD